MPYVKQVVRKDKDGNVLRYDYYLAQNVRKGETVQTTILRKLGSSAVPLKEHEKISFLEVKEPKEQIITSDEVRVDTELLKKMIPVFAQARIKMVLEDAEQTRIRELAQEVM